MEPFRKYLLILFFICILLFPSLEVFSKDFPIYITVEGILRPIGPGPLVLLKLETLEGLYILRGDAIYKLANFEDCKVRITGAFYEKTNERFLGTIEIEQFTITENNTIHGVIKEADGTFYLISDSNVIYRIACDNEFFRYVNPNDCNAVLCGLITTFGEYTREISLESFVINPYIY